ncbi:hypothetical protein ACKI1K_08440 [Streptomyces scabiei]|uniref:hypothetical protein n=1 Tax=Streptomyces scabiei TaxID=1930 RepID=UPI0038F680A3
MDHRPQDPPDGTELTPYGELVFAELVDDDEPGPQQETQAQPADPGTRRRSWGTARRVAHCARTAAGAIAGQILPGLRHALSAARYWLRAGYMSDDEIRRRIINKPLEADLARREEARTAIRRAERKLKRLLEDAAAYGLETSDKQSIRDLSLEIRRRRNGLAALQSVPFAAEQPTEEQIRRARSLMAFGRFSALVPVLGAAGAAAASAPASLFAAVPMLGAGGWWLTHHPLELVERPIPEDLLLPELAPPPVLEDATTAGAPGGDSPEEDRTPFPIAQASTTEEAGEALLRALLHEGQDVDQVTDVTGEPWGWSARVTFNTGTPDDLNKDDTYKGLITLLKLRRNGLLIEGDPDAGDACTVRMMQSSPFSPELVGDVPYRAPLSMSITEPADYGVSMDARKLTFALAGLMLLMVADSGAGKSGVMLALAEVVTACRDAVAFNLDPVGTGVGDLGEAITLDACMDDDKIVATLQFLLALCSARARMRARYGWGNKWRVSPEHPAIVVFVDEWAQLSAQAKTLLIRLLLVGRKEAIWVVGGSQFGTKDWLGEAVGPKLSGKLLGSCRRVDVTELLGGGAISEGYRADLLRAATHTEVNDAGQIYAQGLPGMPDRPVRYKVREVTAEYAAKVGTERAAAGRPDLTFTLAEAGLDGEWRVLLALLAADTPAAHHDKPVELPEIVQILREAFMVEQDPAYLTYDQLHAHLRTRDGERWGRWDETSDIHRLRELGKAVRRELNAAGVELTSQRIRELGGAPRGFYLAALEEAIESLR